MESSLRRRWRGIIWKIRKILDGRTEKATVCETPKIYLPIYFLTTKSNWERKILIFS